MLQSLKIWRKLEDVLPNSYGCWQKALVPCPMDLSMQLFMTWLLLEWVMTENDRVYKPKIEVVVFYDLILEAVYLYFCHILLVTQTTLGQYTSIWIPGDRDHWGPAWTTLLCTTATNTQTDGGRDCLLSPKIFPLFCNNMPLLSTLRLIGCLH